MRVVFTFILLIAITTPAWAHVYWFEPESFFMKIGQSTPLRLYVGEALKKDDERPYQSAKTNAFMLFSPAGKADIRSMADDDKTPIMNFSGDRAGSYLFSIVRNWSYITLEADKFEDYLREDGMEYIIAERKRLGESGKEGRERYSRYIKTILQIGDAKTSSATTRVDSRLEIVPLDNPYSKKVGGKIRFQIWFDKSPLANVAVFADNRDGEKLATQKATTDKDGKGTFKLTGRGVWLIRLVYMQRCQKNCSDADWESFWGALSFGVR